MDGQENHTERDLPAPGVYREIDMRRYHQWEAASNSRLSRLLKSPAHMKAYVEEPVKDTPALLLGRAIHVAVLEPDDFTTRYMRGPEGDRRTKAVKAAWAELEAQHPKAEILRHQDYDTCLAVRDSVWETAAAAGLMDGPGDVELSLVWQDEEGAHCKARWDRHSPEIAGGTIVDLKTTRDASPRDFERSIFNFGYHRQAAMYLMGAAAHDAPVEHYTIIAVEKGPPYGVATYRLTEGAVSAGAEEVRPLLKLYAECDRSGYWPGYPDEVRDVSLPPWAWGVVDERVERLEGAA